MARKHAPPTRIIDMDPIVATLNPRYGWAWSKHPSGIIQGSSGAPNWAGWYFSGTPQTTRANYEAIPAPTREVYFVSKLAGNDNNSGKSNLSPFKSLTKALTMHAPGDHIYLMGGERWDDELIHPLPTGVAAYLKSGPNESEPSVISFYGNNGLRPILSSGEALINTYNRGGLRNVIIDGIHVHSKHKDPLDPAFNPSQGSAALNFRGGNTYNVLVQDCIIDYAEITFQDDTKNNAFPGYPSNIRLINNIFTGSYNVTTYAYKNARPSNLFCNPCIGLTIRGNVFDYGGWNPFVPGASANQYNHNIYLAASNNPLVTNSYLIENNIICRGSSHGMHCRPGGTVRDNFFSRNSINLQIGYASTAMGEGALPVVEDNVVSECFSMWKGYDNDSMFESSYADDPMRSGAKWGIHFQNYGGAYITAKRNIVQISYVAGDDFVKGSTNVRGINEISGPIHEKEDNIVWMFPNQTGSYSDPGRTLGKYCSHLNGSGDFDMFMSIVKSRPLRGWDSRYTAKSGINQYIREGYQS
jgi:hypothetical protein